MLPLTIDRKDRLINTITFPLYLGVYPYNTYTPGFPPPNLLSQYPSTSTMASQDNVSTVSDFTEYTQDEDDNSCLASQASTTNSDEILCRERAKANKELWSHTRKANGSEKVRDRFRH